MDKLDKIKEHKLALAIVGVLILVGSIGLVGASVLIQESIMYNPIVEYIDDGRIVCGGENCEIVIEETADGYIYRAVNMADSVEEIDDDYINTAVEITG